ncbi:MAG: hypothetical protein U9R39_08885 [Campylobacterota bacterium]|nr:hypothetical protein [Campylobacterota bacterium]
MNKKTNFLFIFTTLLLTTLVVVVSILDIYHSSDDKTIEKKNLFVKTIGLPDLSISTEARYIRHRSLSDINSIFSDGPEHLEYAPTTFITYVGIIQNDNK